MQNGETGNEGSVSAGDVETRAGGRCGEPRCGSASAKTLQDVREQLLCVLVRVPAQEREDVAQEALVELLLRGEIKLLPSGDLLMSAMQVARRVFSNACRQTRRRHHREQRGVGQRAVALADTENLLLVRETLARFVDALDRLPIDHRRVVIACDVEGLSQAEAARTLAMPLGTVKSRCRMARSALERACFWNRPEESP